MFEYHDPDKQKKHCFDKPPEFWDRVVTVLFLLALSLVVFILIFKWLGYFN